MRGFEVSLSRTFLFSPLPHSPLSPILPSPPFSPLPHSPLSPILPSPPFSPLPHSPLSPILPSPPFSPPSLLLLPSLPPCAASSWKGEVGCGAGSSEVGCGAGSSEVGCGAGSSEVGCGAGSSEVGCGAGSSEVGCGAGSSEVGCGAGSSEVGCGAGSSEVGCGAASSEVGCGAGSSEVGCGAASGEVGCGAGSSEVGCGAGSSEVGCGAGSSEVGCGAGSSEVGCGASSSEVGCGAGSSEVGCGAGSSEVGCGAGSSEVGCGAGSSEVGCGAASSEVGCGAGSSEVGCGAGSSEVGCGAGSSEVGCGAGSSEVGCGAGENGGLGAFWWEGLSGPQLRNMCPGVFKLVSFGHVKASPRALYELLKEGGPVLVFPGGSKETCRLKGERYQLRWGMGEGNRGSSSSGDGGMMRMASKLNAIIVPFALVGADDAFDIALDRNDLLASPLGKPFRSLYESLSLDPDTDISPVTTLPGTSLPSLIPLPSRLERVYFYFGTPIDFKNLPPSAIKSVACVLVSSHISIDDSFPSHAPLSPSLRFHPPSFF
ncbi:unnamed protein product [Closterium sp. Naga37s-1]|nr:unnamed protein product [Closterium sp. Naga37s-1]